MSCRQHCLAARDSLVSRNSYCGLALVSRATTLKLIFIHCFPFYFIAGRHTAENISEAFESMLAEFSIADKVTYVISDNASNMVKAFSICFPLCAEDQQTENDETGEQWVSDDEETSVCIADHLPTSRHIRCFAHSLQLCVGDGMKECKLYGALARCSKVCSLLHTSSQFQVSALCCSDWSC